MTSKLNKEILRWPIEVKMALLKIGNCRIITMGRITELDILVTVVREGAYFSNILEDILQSRSYGISLEVDGRCKKLVKSLTMMKILKKKK